MHEDPQVPNFGVPGTGPELKPGMTLAIEPMVNAGGPDVVHEAETGGRSAPPTARSPPTSSTPSRSPTMARWS